MSPCGLAANTVIIGDRKVEVLQGIDISVLQWAGCSSSAHTSELSTPLLHDLHLCVMSKGNCVSEPFEPEANVPFSRAEPVKACQL